MIAMTNFLYRDDQYGVREWRTSFKVLLALSTLYGYIALAASALYHVEHGAAGANVGDYSDAFWLLQMAASTIGFGDVYPVTDWGRRIVVVSFYVGVGLTSYVGYTLASRVMGFTDTAVKNRELRHQLKEVIAQNRNNEQLNAAILARSEVNERLNAEILAHNKLLEARLVEALARLEQQVEQAGPQSPAA